MKVCVTTIPDKIPRRILAGIEPESNFTAHTCLSRLALVEPVLHMLKTDFLICCDRCRWNHENLDPQKSGE